MEERVAASSELLELVQLDPGSDGSGGHPALGTHVSSHSEPPSLHCYPLPDPTLAPQHLAGNRLGGWVAGTPSVALELAGGCERLLGAPWLQDTPSHLWLW